MASREILPGRSFYSLKERFMKTIRKKIENKTGYHHITPDIRARLISG